MPFNLFNPSAMKHGAIGTRSWGCHGNHAPIPDRSLARDNDQSVSLAK
jgi:hypothetical protein